MLLDAADGSKMAAKMQGEWWRTWLDDSAELAMADGAALGREEQGVNPSWTI